MTLQACLKSMRLRTLPLSLSGTVVGISSLGASGCVHPVPTVILLILTTALLQVLSNLSNELGDTLHGTDTAARSSSGLGTINKNRRCSTNGCFYVYRHQHAASYCLHLEIRRAVYATD